MNYFFALAIVTLFFATPIFCLTSVTFDNDFAIFRPKDHGVGFNLDNQVTILFLEKRLYEPSLEISPFGLKITHNVTKNQHHIHFTLYKDGSAKHRKTYTPPENEPSLKNMELAWDTSSTMSIQVLVRTSEHYSTVFSWEDDQENISPFNMTYIAFKTSSSLTIHQRDTFLWISDVLTKCPLQNSEILCDLTINRLRSTSMEERKNSSSKGLRKVMQMKLISKHPNPLYNYEIAIGSHQTSDKTEPQLHIMQHNITKLKMDTFLGHLNLSINISGGNIVISKHNDSSPFLRWSDPTKKDNHIGFKEIKYTIIEVSESALPSRSHNVGQFPTNSCTLVCKTMEESIPWYKLW